MAGFAVLLLLVAGALAVGARQASGKQAVPSIIPSRKPKTPAWTPEGDDTPHESEIPWDTDAWIWEAYVSEDGRVLDEELDELTLTEDGLIAIAPHDADTIILRVPPQIRRADAAPFMLPPTPWLVPEVASWQEGDYAWSVARLRKDDDDTVEVGVWLTDADGVKHRYGFLVRHG